MGRNFVLHLKTGTKIVTEKEAIENALEQEKQGIEPHYVWYDYKRKETIGNLGWLVWSTLNNGVGVVYRRHDGKMIVTTGLQGDFCYM